MIGIRHETKKESRTQQRASNIRQRAMPIEIGLLSSQQDSFEHHEELSKLLTETDVFYVPLRNEFTSDNALHANEDLTDLSKRFDEDLSKKHLIVTFRDIGYSLFLDSVESLPDAHDRSKIRISGKMIVDGICIKFFGCFDYGHQTQQINGVGRIALDEGYYRELSSVQVSETDIKDDVVEKSMVSEPIIVSKTRQPTAKSKVRIESKTRPALSISLPSETVQITTSFPNARTHLHSPGHMPYPLKSPRLKPHQQISSPVSKTSDGHSSLLSSESSAAKETHRFQMGSHTPQFSPIFPSSTPISIPIPSTPNTTLSPGSLPQPANLFSLPTSHSLPAYIYPAANIAYIPTSTNPSGSSFDFSSLNGNTSFVLITNPNHPPVHFLTSIDQRSLQFTPCFPTNLFPSSIMPSRTCNILPSESFATLPNKRHDGLEEDKQQQQQQQSESNKQSADQLPFKKRRHTGQQSRMATMHDGDVSDESLKKRSNRWTDRDMSSSSIKHLIVILDLNPFYWSDKVSTSSTTLTFKQYLNVIIQFCNAYVAFDINHRLTIIGCSNNETSFLYPDPTNESLIIPTVTKTNMFEQLFVVDRVVENNLKKFLQHLSPMHSTSGSMITMALTQALCYINRLIRDTLAGDKNAFRILIIQTTNDTSKQYMNFMNAVFTSEKLNVPIDGCILNNESSLLQQACDLTSGIYLRVPDTNGLLQYLLWLYLTDKEVRKMLALPTKVAVDYRPACFCHHKLIDTGYVCSVCLSIYCDNASACSTCRSAFDGNHVATGSTSNGTTDLNKRQIR